MASGSELYKFWAQELLKDFVDKVLPEWKKGVDTPP